MEHAELEAAVRELADFAAVTGRAMKNHLEQLQRHETILEEEYRADVSHHDAIQTLRAEVQTLGEQISSLQRSVIKILQAMGLPLPENDAPGKIN